MNIKLTYKIDLLFFNIELNCYVAVELKIRECKAQDIGQLDFYVHLVDTHLKKRHHASTIGVLVVKKKNKYVIEYVTNQNLFVTTYEIQPFLNT